MEPLSVQRVRVLVDFFGLSLQDADDSWFPERFPGGFTAEEFVSEHPGRVDLTTAGHTQEVGVTAEVWGREPSPAPGEWDEVAVARVECRSGVLRLWSVSGPGVEDISLPAAPATWGVRVQCRGREEARRASSEGVPEGVEQYVVQFWPV